MIDYRRVLEDHGYDVWDSGSGYMMMTCPLPEHDDSNPSFSVNTANGKWRCFGCEARGTFAELLSEIDGISVSEALAQLKADRSTDAIISSIEQALEDDDESIEYLSLESFHNVFPPVEAGSKAWDYLRITRRLASRTIQRYGFRWCDHGKYQGRVILPIRMPDGKLLSYVARTIYRDVLPKTRKARSGARTLYGIYELGKYIGKTKYVILVEGEIDAVYLQQYGVPAIANMGTSVINKYQIRILRKLRATIVLSYDGDDAGRKAIYGNGNSRQGELSALSRYMKVLSIDLSEGMDPNDLSGEEVKNVYERYVVKK